MTARDVLDAGLRIVLVLHSLVKSDKLALPKVFLWLDVNRLVSFENRDQLIFNVLVVRLVGVLQPVDVVEDVLYLHDVLCLIPQQSFWCFQASSLDVFHFVHCVLLDLSPY